MTYAKEKLKVFAEKRAEAKEQFLTLCDKIKREKARYNILEAYQCSFSTTSDNLCLWNYYTHGDSVQGYNLDLILSFYIKVSTQNTLKKLFSSWKGYI